MLDHLAQNDRISTKRYLQDLPVQWTFGRNERRNVIWGEWSGYRTIAMNYTQKMRTVCTPWDLIRQNSSSTPTTYFSFVGYCLLTVDWCTVVLEFNAPVAKIHEIQANIFVASFSLIGISVSHEKRSVYVFKTYRAIFCWDSGIALFLSFLLRKFMVSFLSHIFWLTHLTTSYLYRWLSSVCHISSWPCFNRSGCLQMFSWKTPSDLNALQTLTRRQCEAYIPRLQSNWSHVKYHNPRRKSSRRVSKLSGSTTRSGQGKKLS